MRLRELLTMSDALGPERSHDGQSRARVADPDTLRRDNWHRLLTQDYRVLPLDCNPALKSAERVESRFQNRAIRFHKA